jgi:hypothetical protein
MDVIFTALLGGVALNLLASEVFAWGPRLSECLMRRAVRRLMPEIQERMQEEWAAHLQTIPPGLWRIVVATGFYLAAVQINVALRAHHCAKPEGAPADGWPFTIIRSLTGESFTIKDGTMIRNPLPTAEDLEALNNECPDPLPSNCEESSDGDHKVKGAKLYISIRYRGRKYYTFQGPCTLCKKWVDTGAVVMNGIVVRSAKLKADRGLNLLDHSG